MASSSGSNNPPVVPLSPTKIRLEAKRLLDVALEAKISDGSSHYLKSLLDNISTEFSAFHDSEDSSRQESDDSDGGRDSPQLSLSESQDVEANRAKKELLIKILSAQISTTARSGSGSSSHPVDVGGSSLPMASAMPSTFVSTASQASTIDPMLLTDRMRSQFPIGSSDAGSLGGTGSFGGTTTAFYTTTGGTSSGMEGRSHTSTIIPPNQQPRQTSSIDMESHKKLAEANDTIGLLSAELDRHRRISESTMEGENIERRAIEERCKRMTAMLEAETALRRQYEDKAKQHDKLTEDMTRLQQENEGLRETMEQQGKALQALAESEKTATTTAADSTKTRDLLMMDKQFLQQELRAAEARVDEKARLMESYQSKALAMETKAGQLTGRTDDQ